MPIYRATIEKHYNGEFWTNVYHVDAGDLAGATAIANQIMLIERTMHFAFVQFTKYRVDDMVPNTQNYQTTPVNQVGANGVLGEDAAAPLFCTVRVDFAVRSQRPSRKYYRGCLSEANMGVMRITDALRVAFNTNVATPLADLAGFVDERGNAIYEGTTYPNVQMRQLRRGSKKKVAP